MFPSSSRSASHSVMAQQGGYFGYYPQQTTHPYHATEFNCNFQPIMPPSQMTDGFQGSWYNAPMYMSQSAHPTSIYQQRGQSGYEDWGLGSSITHGLSSSGAPSPLPLYSVPPSSSTSSTNSTVHSSVSGVQPPHTPSPCALPNGTTAGQSSPSYYSAFCKAPSEFGGETDGTHSTPEGEVAPISDVALECHKSPSHALRPQQPRSPYEWMKKSYQTPNGTTTEENTYIDIDNMTLKGSQEEEAEIREGTWKVGKTRTKDKYRVVYSDHQRLELEKEFHYSRYITIRRKSELATMLGLSERQVKIWFQNRRAKERKQMKKREEIVTKDKMETGIAFHHGGSLHPLSHHHEPPPPPSIHPPQIHVHNHPHLNQHHNMGPKTQSLMMDVKPNLGLD